MPPRPIRPKNDPLIPDGIDAPGDGKGSKRKAVSSACIPCRKRKSKCDGNTPSCSTCVAVYRTECNYDADSDPRRKIPSKRDAPTSHRSNDALDVILSSLCSLPEADSIALLRLLRSDPNLDTWADALRNNTTVPPRFAAHNPPDPAHQDTPPPTAHLDRSIFPPSLPRAESSGETSLSQSSFSLGTEQDLASIRAPRDPEFIEHLFNLFQCWILPFYGFVSWEHFMRDMTSGRTKFCSAILINAILSFACHYSDRVAARTEPNTPATAGDHFYAEAKRLLDATDKCSITTVQALGIMSLRETSAGRDSNGFQLAGRCVRMALELGLHLSEMRNSVPAMEAEIRKVTFWAVFNLETICAVAFGRLSQLPRSAADIETPSVNMLAETHTWRPYEDTNLALSPSAEQPARSMLFKDQLSKLSALASDMVNTFYAPRERFTSRRLAAAYAQYQDWFSNLPACFRLENTSLPHVLVLHMYYYGCVLHLFRPYIKLDLRAANLFPHETCTFCANEISALMHVLRAMYGLRRVTLAVTSLLLSASTIHLLNLPSEQAAVNLTQALQDLQAISVNHRFAARAVEIIRQLSNKWNIVLPEATATITAYNIPGPKDVQTQAPSAFFAASIPRSSSSGPRMTLGESPSFPPPTPSSRPQAAQHGSTSMPPAFFGDARGADVGAAQGNAAFWTPFPAQVMPLVQRDLMQPMMDISQLEDPTNWHMFGASTGSTQQHDSDGGKMDEGMGGGEGEWNWV